MVWSPSAFGQEKGGRFGPPFLHFISDNIDVLFSLDTTPIRGLDIQMNITTIPIENVFPYDANPRANQAVDKVAKSLEEFGFQQPIVCDESNVIIVGHTRFAAAKQLGFTEVPVLYANLSEDKAKAYRIADNRTNQDGDWDFALLTKELEDLLAGQFDLSSLGFEETELESFLSVDNAKVDWFNEEDHWQDMPSFDHNDLKPYRTVVVHVRDADGLADLSSLIGQEIRDNPQEKRNGVPVSSIWHPVRQQETLKDKGYGA
jgi:hypothetical protein